MAGRSWSKVSHPFLRPAGRPGVSVLLEDRLLIGEYPTPDDVRWLRDEHGIQAVLSLQDDIDLAYKSIDQASLDDAYREAGLVWRRIGVTDGEPEDLGRALPEILDVLRQLLAERGCVYLHCNAGFNRAPSVAIAYLHVTERLSIEEAHAFVKARRPCAPYLSVLRRFFG